MEQKPKVVRTVTGGGMSIKHTDKRGRIVEKRDVGRVVEKGSGRK